MKSLLLVILGALFAAFPATSGEERKAKLLLELKTTNERKISFKLNPRVLEDISNLQQPIRVVAAVGNARVGKSTTLNLISHIWEGNMSDDDSLEETFKTGDTFESVTRNVWAHVIHPRNRQEGSVLLLDVQGTDLGDDRITEQLSIFTAMMSSGLNIFVKDFVGNGDVDFLYRISRLSDLIFKKKTRRNFPSLRIVVRSNLTPPKDFENFIRDEIFRPNNEKGDMIQRYFPKDSIVVCQIPSVSDSKILNNLTELHNSRHWIAFHKLMTEVRKSPEKKTFEGNPVDGKALKDIAENVVKAMNENEWTDFGDTYSTIERDICSRSYEKHVEPVLKRRSTAHEFEKEMMRLLNKFKEECFLEKDRKNVEEKLLMKLGDTIKEEDAEERRRTEEEEKRKQQDEWLTYEKLKYVAGILATNIFTYYLFSDEHLKNNITTMPFCEYNTLGLTGVCWTWNDIAEENFGLTGQNCGVIAQEVQKLYPWAVAESKDGYLQVAYDALDQMINYIFL